MTLRSIALNGLSVEDDLGLYVSALSGFHDIPARTYQTVATPLEPGVRPLSIGSTVDARTPTITFLVPATSFADRAARIDALAGMLNGQVELSSLDAPTRVMYGYLTKSQVTTPYKEFVTPEVNAALSFTAFDPLWYDRDPILTNVPAGSTVALPIGTGPVSRVTITAMGPSTGPRIYLLTDQTGQEVQRMTVSGNLTSSQTETIDCKAGTVVLQDGTSLFGNFTPGGMFQLRPPRSFAISCSAAALRVAHVRTYVA